MIWQIVIGSRIEMASLASHEKLADATDMGGSCQLEDERFTGQKDLVIEKKSIDLKYLGRI
jgi:hypothetical protein